MSAPHDAFELAMVCAVAAVAATLQGSVGFGFSLVAAPVLALIDPAFVPGPVIFGLLVVTLLMSYRERQAIDLSGMRWALVGRFSGTVLAGAALAAISRDQLTLLFGALVLLAVAMSVSGLRLAPTTGTLLAAGVLSGFMGTTSSIGGPPVALVYQDAPGARLRATMSGYSLCGAAMSLVAVGAVGRFGRSELLSALTLVPGVLAGFAISARTVSILDRRGSRAAVLGVSAAAGLGVLARHLF